MDINRTGRGQDMYALRGRCVTKAQECGKRPSGCFQRSSCELSDSTCADSLPEMVGAAEGTIAIHITCLCLIWNVVFRFIFMVFVLVFCCMQRGPRPSQASVKFLYPSTKVDDAFDIIPYLLSSTPFHTTLPHNNPPHLPLSSPQ